MSFFGSAPTVEFNPARRLDSPNLFIFGPTWYPGLKACGQSFIWRCFPICGKCKHVRGKDDKGRLEFNPARSLMWRYRQTSASNGTAKAFKGNPPLSDDDSGLPPSFCGFPTGRGRRVGRRCGAIPLTSSCGVGGICPLLPSACSQTWGAGGRKPGGHLVVGWRCIKLEAGVIGWVSKESGKFGEIVNSACED